MKNTRRQTILAVMGILLVSLAFFGCGQKEEPDISIKTFSVGILHEDEDALKRFGADKESFHKNFMEGFVSEYQRASGGIFTDDQARAIGEAVLTSISRANVSTKTLSKEGDKATVEVTVDVIDPKKIDMTKLVQSVQKEVVAKGAPNQILDVMTNKLEDEIKNIPISGQTTLQVDCTYNKDLGVWVPNNEQDYEMRLGQAVLGES